MRAMILAAGRGKRMGELTTHVPKPLLRIGDQYLIEYSIYNLAKAGVRDIVINVSYHAEKIKMTLGNGARYGVNLVFSEEVTPLETGGGIVKALPLLGNDPFIVVSSDIISSYPFENLFVPLREKAHLVLVDNPYFHLQGDFGLKNGYVDLTVSSKLTYANIGVYSPDFFANCTASYFPLSRLLFPAIKNHQVTGEYFNQIWHNVGTPAELATIRSRDISKVVNVQ